MPKIAIQGINIVMPPGAALAGSAHTGAPANIAITRKNVFTQPPRARTAIGLGALQNPS
jgi:hypothetical protein